MTETVFFILFCFASVCVIGLLYLDLFAPRYTAEVVPRCVSGALIGSSSRSIRRLIDGHIRIDAPPDFRVAPGHLLVLTMRRSLVPRQVTVIGALDPETKQTFVSATAPIAAACAAGTGLFGLLCLWSTFLGQTEPSVLMRAWALFIQYAVMSALFIKRHFAVASLRSSIKGSY